MIWLTWRQHRTQLILGFGALTAAATYLAVLGLDSRDRYRQLSAHCTGGGCGTVLRALLDEYGTAYDFAGYLLLALPGLLGIFWGAPMIARELEAGTHRLVWNQSVTRTGWLAAKLALITVAGVVLTGLYSLALTWSAARIDLVADNRFQPLLFASRNLAPLGYAAFAVVLGTTAGLLVRRTVPAIAVTLVVFAIVQVLVPNLVRPHFAEPVTTDVPLTAETIRSLSMIGHYGSIGGLSVPGGPWVLSTSPMLDDTNSEVGHTDWYQNCVNQAFDQIPHCLAAGDLHVRITEQPAGRYWRFQRIETGLYAVLAVVLAGACLWRIRRPVT